MSPDLNEFKMYTYKFSRENSNLAIDSCMIEFEI